MGEKTVVVSFKTDDPQFDSTGLWPLESLPALLALEGRTVELKACIAPGHIGPRADFRIEMVKVDLEVGRHSSSQGPKGVQVRATKV